MRKLTKYFWMKIIALTIQMRMSSQKFGIPKIVRWKETLFEKLGFPDQSWNSNTLVKILKSNFWKIYWSIFLKPPGQQFKCACCDVWGVLIIKIVKSLLNKLPRHNFSNIAKLIIMRIFNNFLTLILNRLTVSFLVQNWSHSTFHGEKRHFP